jgi:hypothetical protein
MKNTRFWAEIMLAAGVLVLGFLYWQKFTEQAAVGVAVEAKPSGLVSNIPTESVHVATGVIAYKPAAKKKLKLPQAVQDNPAQVVTSATTVPSDFRPHTVTTVLDTQTGKTTAYDTRMALHWAALNVRGEAGIGYGRDRDGQIARVFVRQGLASIKAVRIVGEVNADMPINGNPSRTNATVLVTAAYQW